MVSPKGEPLAGLTADGDFGSVPALDAAEDSAAGSLPVSFEIKGRKYTTMSAVAGDQHLASLIGQAVPAPSICLVL
jgi:hypothetical protein